MVNLENPFEDLKDTLEDVCEEVSSRKKRTAAKFFIVKDVVFETGSSKEIGKYLKDNYQDGMSIVKGFQSFPRRKESFEF